ncbi:MAG: hypothetical protein PHR75_04900 [Sulfurovum sp.]|mgnify:CR=1 FL=1|nr:hypothetical protein [Sulfurovum sp.]MDD3603274.1 hypothetical protein [Sulfurovum sp.]
MELYTRYIYEKKWSKTTKEQALRIVQEEMPQTDAEGTLKYILEQLQKGKTLTLGECRFKMASCEGSLV